MSICVFSMLANHCEQTVLKLGLYLKMIEIKRAANKARILVKVDIVSFCDGQLLNVFNSIEKHFCSLLICCFSEHENLQNIKFLERGNHTLLNS